MMEIRPVRGDEAAEFLKLLCDIFQLDFDRARGVFFDEPFFDLNRKWALFEKGQIVSVLTTVPISFGWGNAIGVAGVATKKELQGRGYAAQLLGAVIEASKKAGETGVLLFARERGLYEKLGLRVMDKVYRGVIEVEGEMRNHEIIPFPMISDIYTHWAEAHPGRLRRDEQRWNYWRWNLRVCTPFYDGYVCDEGSLIRECLPLAAVKSWCLPEGIQWIGLDTMTENLCVPVKDKEFELYLMGAGFPEQPQMYMTDQF